MMFDLAIIGGGPAGFFAAECAGNQGLKVILFEKDILGGVCINEGCIPAKTLLHSIQAYNIVKDAEKYGIVTDKNASFSMELALQQKEKVVRNMQNIISDKFNNDIATLVQGKAYIKGRSADGSITISCDHQEYRSKNLLICTGSRPDMPEIPGIENPLVCTYDTMLNSTEPQKKLVMIGGGQVSIELAHIYNSLGAEIIILEENDEILLDTDNEICSVLREEYAKRGIITHLNTRISKIEGNKVFFSVKGVEMTAEGDRIICDIGRRPNLEGFGLENLDVECYRKGIRINNQMQTSEPNVFAAGDVTGFSKSAHAAYCEAAVAINTILGIEDHMNFKAVPTCVFSSPEIAHVGITEETLNLAWRPHKIIRLPLTQSSRYVIQDNNFEGLCKIIVGEDETILGVHIIGNNCSEAIVAAVMAVESQMTISEWRKIVFPYPTIGEVMKGALIYAKIPFEPRKS